MNWWINVISPQGLGYISDRSALKCVGTLFVVDRHQMHSAPLPLATEHPFRESAEENRLAEIKSNFDFCLFFSSNPSKILNIADLFSCDGTESFLFSLDCKAGL